MLRYLAGATPGAMSGKRQGGGGGALAGARAGASPGLLGYTLDWTNRGRGRKGPGERMNTELIVWLAGCWYGVLVGVTVGMLIAGRTRG